MKNLFWIVQLSLLIFISCSEDEIDKVQSENSYVSVLTNDEVKVVNGRIYFPNREIFKKYYAELKSKNTDEIVEFVEDKFYSKDFYSLVPLYNEKTEQKQVNRHLNNLKGNNVLPSNFRNASDEEILEDLDDLEDIFGEEVFNSFLNQEAEILIGNKVYKYTDTGLFIVDLEDLNTLNNMLDQKGISKNLIEPTPYNLKMDYINETNPCGGLVPVTTFVDEEPLDYDFFIAQAQDCYVDGGSGSSGGSGSGSGTGTNSSAPGDELALISQGLDSCNPNNPFFGNLFGTVKTCKDTYQDDKRVKVKYYDLDLYLAYAMGVKVKHQRKTWLGVWVGQNAPEVALGLNSLTYQFNAEPSPLPINTTPSARIYLHNDRMYETLNGYYNAVYQGDIPIPDLPFSNMFKNQIDWLVEVSVSNYTSWDSEEDVREFFYETLFDTTKNLFENFSNRDRMKKGVVVVSSNNKKWVQIYDFNNSCTDCKEKGVVIDWGIVSPMFTYTFGTGTGSGLEITSWDFDFRNPNIVAMSSYGMARKNGQWHGKRLIFEDNNN